MCIPCFYLGNLDEENAKKDTKSLKEIIENTKITDKVDNHTYLDVKGNPLKFAIYDDTTDAYYFVTDGEYIYIAYMTLEQYNNLYSEDKTEEVKINKIEGVTSLVPKDVKELAIDTYNEMFELAEEEALTLADYESYFGSVAIDMTNEYAKGGIMYGIGFLFLLFGFILLIINLIRKCIYKKNVKKIDSNMMLKLNDEMNNSESFYYESSKLYLTPNYIVNFGMNFSVIDYKDIIWMYVHTQRTNGVKTNQSIMIQDKYGKVHNIASLSLVTKAKKEEYDEIFNTIAGKNDKIMVGYTKENMKKAKEIVKEHKALNPKM